MRSVPPPEAAGRALKLQETRDSSMVHEERGLHVHSCLWISAWQGRAEGFHCTKCPRVPQLWQRQEEFGVGP